MFVYVPNIKFHGNPLSENLLIYEENRTDLTKLTDAHRDEANAPKTCAFFEFAANILNNMNIDFM